MLLSEIISTTPKLNLTFGDFLKQSKPAMDALKKLALDEKWTAQQYRTLMSLKAIDLVDVINDKKIEDDTGLFVIRAYQHSKCAALIHLTWTQTATAENAKFKDRFVKWNTKLQTIPIPLKVENECYVIHFDNDTVRIIKTKNQPNLGGIVSWGEHAFDKHFSGNYIINMPVAAWTVML